MKYLLVIWIALLAGCATPAGEQPKLVPDEVGTSFALEQFYQQWRGTPYRLGGYDKKGIDCSGFTQLTYREVFHQALPRTTLEQRKVGAEVAKNALRSGDLLFFNTKRGQWHVGIYQQEGEFIHASTSKGVIRSSLDNPYWSPRFRQARRLDF